MGSSKFLMMKSTTAAGRNYTELSRPDSREMEELRLKPTWSVRWHGLIM